MYTIWYTYIFELISLKPFTSQIHNSYDPFSYFILDFWTVSTLIELQAAIHHIYDKFSETSPQPKVQIKLQADFTVSQKNFLCLWQPENFNRAKRKPQIYKTQKKLVVKTSISILLQYLLDCEQLNRIIWV